jgi:hypothetical protein
VIILIVEWCYRLFTGNQLFESAAFGSHANDVL